MTLDTLDNGDESVATQARPHAMNKIVPILLVLLGLIVLVYPVVATQWNNVKQERVAKEYSKLEKQADPEKLNKEIEEAREYNHHRNTGPILDPWLAKISKDNNEYREYLEQLNQFDTMARLVVPAGNIDLPVYHGTDTDTLQRGVGHLFGSDLPVGGEGSHAVLTGHTGLPNATLFDNLKNVKEGDPIYVQVSGERLKYQVDQIKVVLPDETGDLAPEQGKDYLTLVTCTPYGINSHRLLVRGHQVPMDAEDHRAIDNAKGAKWQWWMWVLLAAAGAVALGLLWWLWRLWRARREDNPEEETLNAQDLINRLRAEGNEDE